MPNLGIKEAHIIHHTHWDREWFLTHLYTTEWIPGLIKKIETIAVKDPQFKYLLDGQTLIVEDLIKLKPNFKQKVKKLVKAGNLIIGPYYCQPDWRIVKGESLIRNLEIGREMMKEFGGKAKFGWLVDTFGQISQSPQIHRMFGIEAVYIWRGIPILKPYFTWVGADGSKVLALFLIGGYRNLYGVTLFPQLALEKLLIEVKNLSKYYPTDQIPLFDGYDLEFDPKNTARFYLSSFVQELKQKGIKVISSDPQRFVNAVKRQLKDLVQVKGELLSGKYYSTFPGTLSARTYLKILNNDLEQIIYRIYEPLATLADRFGAKLNLQKHKQNLKELLTNQIHDPICGVSIDLVHERMEYSYKNLYDYYQKEIQHLLGVIATHLKEGKYYFSPNPFLGENWVQVGKKLWLVKSKGVEIAPLESGINIRFPHRKITTPLTWSNQYYTVKINQRGEVLLGPMKLGYFQLYQDYGDAYSGEAFPPGFPISPCSSPQIEQESEKHLVVSFPAKLKKRGREVKLLVKIIMDPTPIIKWEVEIDSKGSDFNVCAVFDLAQKIEQLLVGMPFDVVSRQCQDTDLLPRQVNYQTQKMLLGQRDLVKTVKFPFHDFVASSRNGMIKAVFAQGIREYQADEKGKIYLTLRRATEWMARKNLKYRLGDAASIMYVPEARCERKVVHKLGFAFFETKEGILKLYQLNEAFQNEPIIFVNYNQGKLRKIKLLQWPLPITTIFTQNGQCFFRTFNPTQKKISLPREKNKFQIVDPLTKKVKRQRSLSPKQIALVKFSFSKRKKASTEKVLQKRKKVKLLVFPSWRVGKNKSVPNKKILSRLQKKVAQLTIQLEKLKKQLSGLKGKRFHQVRHQFFIKEREKAETELVLAFINLKQKNKGNLAKYLFRVDPEIRKLARYKNLTRINRRIYDHLSVLFDTQ